MSEINLNELIDNNVSSKWENLLLSGNTYKNYSTLIVVATRGTTMVSGHCPECKASVELKHWVGLHPWVVESWKRFVKPMNVPISEMIISGYEVGEAYNLAIEQFLNNEQLKNFKYILFLEDDIIVPFMPNSFGPLIQLYQRMGDYDVASGLYWTKGEPPLPLVYGNGNMDSVVPFEVNLNWKSGDVVEVNGCGMGFALMKRSIFEDPRLKQPFFKTVNEMSPRGSMLMTQDLYFYKNIKNLGYKICVDTGIKCGHLDMNTEKIY